MRLVLWWLCRQAVGRETIVVTHSIELTVSIGIVVFILAVISRTLLASKRLR